MRIKENEKKKMRMDLTVTFFSSLKKERAWSCMMEEKE